MLQKHWRLAVQLFFLLFVIRNTAISQDINLAYIGGESWFLTERSNWSTYINGTYKGLTHREVHSKLSAGSKVPEGREYSGFFFKILEMNRDARNVSLPVDESYKSRFILRHDGSISLREDQGFPEYRNFPIFPADPVFVGSVWSAAGTRCIDPKNDGHLTDLPILVEYRLSGESVLNGEATWRIDAKYATRYPQSLKPARKDPTLKSATGTHECQIIVRKEDGAVLVIMDHLDETFYYTGGGNIRFKGNTAIFAKTATHLDVITNILSNSSNLVSQGEQNKEEKKAGDDTQEELETAKAWITENTEEGVRISIRDLRFEADSDILLPAENKRLDTIAETLRKIENGHFLVEGHTASTGKPEGEMLLSVARAQKIIAELCVRGMRADQFIYRGFGGTIPVGDNSTTEGRAQNRRVEITVLD